MKVKSLIAKLQKLDGMLDVVFEDPNNSYKFEINNVKVNDKENVILTVTK